MKIVTEFWAKPIPTDQFDWSAHDDDLGGDCSKIGYGRTEAEAIEDFAQAVRDFTDIMDHVERAATDTILEFAQSGIGLEWYPFALVDALQIISIARI